MCSTHFPDSRDTSIQQPTKDRIFSISSYKLTHFQVFYALPFSIKVKFIIKYSISIRIRNLYKKKFGFLKKWLGFHKKNPRSL